MTTHAEPERAPSACSVPDTETAKPPAGARPASAPDRPPVIATLTGLRALAAGWVVFHHFDLIIFDLLPGLKFLHPPAHYGYLGVEVFFVLSGFIIAYNYAERVDSVRMYGRYLWARAARIYPVHLATLGMMVAYAMVFPSIPGFTLLITPHDFIGSVFMLQGVPGFGVVNIPSWSVTCETAAYLVFPLLAVVALKLSPRVALASAGVALICGVVLLYLVMPSSGTPMPQWVVAYPVIWARIASEFSAGVLLWAWWRRKQRGSRRWDVVALTCVVLTICMSYFVEGWTAPSFLAVPLIALFVMSCASTTGPLSRLLSSKLMQWGGKVSYSLYMSHFIVLMMFLVVTPWKDYIDAPLPIRIVLVALALPWTAGTAAFLYYFVEEPARKFAMSYLYKGRRPAAR